MMKDKRCKHCNKMMSYKDWVKITILPSDWFWEKKMYCDRGCGRMNK